MIGTVQFEDLDLNFGYSCIPNRLYYYSEEENEFRMEVRKWCQENIQPVSDKIDKERNTKLAVEILRKMKPYLNIIISSHLVC